MARLRVKPTPEYQAWMSMKRRCYYPKCPGYHRYGGRGITVCDRWLFGTGDHTGFKCFLMDMGFRPVGEYSLDRIDNDGNYEPSNCQWSTPKEQAGHTSRTKYIEVDGQRVKFLDAAKELGITSRAFHNRVRYGWSDEEAVKIPMLKYGQRKPKTGGNKP